MDAVSSFRVNPVPDDSDGRVQQMLDTERGAVYIEGPLSSEQLSAYTMCSGLCKFRQPGDQHLALIDIAKLPEGLVFIARCGSLIVGYITFHYPEFERWAESGIPCLLELGALEVSTHWRGLGISRELVQIPFYNGRLEEKIIVSMECYWCWDLRNTDLSIWEYRNMMEKLLTKPGFETKATDDPDISSHPANILSVRIGSRVCEDDIARFEALRFRRRWLL
ncbi:MAG: N-acetyltransferase [Dethiobacter sp.]|jgi:acetoin utilization protein AcuA|nr:N-acetyltransferase [Dethiobacter sp.]